MSFYKKAIIAGLINLLVFLLVFFAFQNEPIYRNTLGRVSKNYERSGDWQNYDIKKVSKPYEKITDEKFNHWDADIYKSIKERMYVQEEFYFGYVRGAFFPLFPLIWKISSLNSIGISILNYLLFVISIMLLIQHFLKAGERDKLIIFILCITLPSTVVFMIPYTESLFIFTSTLAFIGIARKNYLLYFTACVCVAMVRPATLFVFAAVFAVEFLAFLFQRNIKTTLRELVLKLSPFVTGYFLAIIIQYIFSHSFTTYIDSQKHWSGKIGSITTFSDWSVEGFGLAAGGIFFVAFPALIYVFWLLFRNKDVFRNTADLFKSNEENAFNYISLVSFIYLSGILVFGITVSGGNLHSFSRFILCTPAFYVALIYVYNRLSGLSSFTRSLLLFDLCLAAYFFFLAETDYGGARSDFSFFGSYLMVANFAFLMFYSQFNTKFKLPVLSVLLTLNIVWNTWLLNCFLSDSWIFT